MTPARLCRHAAWRAAPAGRLTALLLAAAVGGCGQIQVRPLATAEPERPAYALSGPSLDGLRDEARRLCPSGADVLRAAQRLDGVHAPQPDPQNWYGRWWLKTQLSLTPPAGDSQLVVLCQPVPGLGQLAAAPAQPPAATSGAEKLTGTGNDRADNRPAAGRSAAGSSLAPVGEGALRAAAPSSGGRRVEAASAEALRGLDLRAGMSAAMPANAITSVRTGPAPAVPGTMAPPRTENRVVSPKDANGDARSAPSGSDTAGSTPRVRSARPASAPILTY